MYELCTIEDVVAVHPTKFSLALEDAVKDSIQKKYEGKIDNDIGVALSVVDVKSVGDGKVLPGDPSVHYPVNFTLLSWMPREHEIVEGEVIDITEFGAFIRAGALDGLVHISQLADRFVKNASDVVKVQQKVKVTVLEVDTVRKRISLSLKNNPQISGDNKTGS